MLESRGAGASPSKPALCISLCIRDVEAGGQVGSRLWSRYTTTEFMATSDGLGIQNMTQVSFRHLAAQNSR